jgi:glycosyltransferase involved in cell wall biosynthesis
MKVTVITDIPSPYQVELFDAVSERVEDFTALYVRKADPTRRWSPQEARHVSACLEDLSPDEHYAHASAPGLLVFSYYGNPVVDRMMQVRRGFGLPWCFWGERLGFRHSGVVGRAYRRWKLRTLHGSRAPIWGIGQWAVESYVREFGSRRAYYNVPYASDLDRFSRVPSGTAKLTGRRVVLYSGSLSERKGVDLLAEAFVRIYRDHPDCELWLLGDGPLHADLVKVLSPAGERVRFLGFKDWDELPAVYAEADVLCVPSRHDGWALVVPEGLAAGLPVIGTDRTGAALDLIQPGHNGWLAEAGDADSLERALRAAAALSARDLEAMSGAASATAVAHSLATGAERFLHAARETLGRWKR